MTGSEPQLNAGAEKLKRKPRGKAFAAGNPFRFKPGKVGGRPVGAESRATKISRAYSDWLEQMVEGGEMTRAEALAHRMGNIALTARPGAAVQAAKEIADRVEGKPLQAIQVSQVMDEDTARRLVEIGSMLERFLPKPVPALEAEIIEEGIE